ncbi:hypothetical protein [Mycobacterium sp.]|uniref:hypothetical protein n=1 Tax=Mycobacterium sp. TaxID=1785 RepID=UPI002BE64653|nr:hypothetical protein [Mycobacterium sp.]HKP41877.1 hypothetical protein [Mycobacterium sp.]
MDFAGFTDALVTSGRREVCRRRGSDWTPTSLSLAVSSAVAGFSGGDDSEVVSAVVWGRGLRTGRGLGASACADCFGGSADAAFGGPAELSELESALDGDGSSAWAIPLANPTVTQADSRNAATINRNHH